MKKSCTIIISHYESLPFLRRCIEQIRKYRHEEVNQQIIIADQSSKETFSIILNEFLQKGDAAFNMKPLYSGYNIDYLIRHYSITSDYICQLHADAFPISDKWLLAPITMMEENNFAFSGVLQFICDKPESIYPPNKGVFGMAQCFNIGKTEVYREMSLEGGFTRFHNRLNSGLTWNSNEWADWAEQDYQNRGSDDDVPAFFWEDNNRQHDKMSFGFSGKMGISGEESNYGTIIEDLVFHFGYHLESRGVMPQMGAKYREWTRRINEDYSDELLNEMLSEAHKQPLKAYENRMVWDGVNKIASRSPHTINNRLEELKK